MYLGAISRQWILLGIVVVEDDARTALVSVEEWEWEWEEECSEEKISIRLYTLARATEDTELGKM
jgi:hypothetical protein